MTTFLTRRRHVYSSYKPTGGRGRCLCPPLSPFVPTARHANEIRARQPDGRGGGLGDDHQRSTLFEGTVYYVGRSRAEYQLSSRRRHPGCIAVVTSYAPGVARPRDGRRRTRKTTGAGREGRGRRVEVRRVESVGETRVRVGRSRSVRLYAPVTRTLLRPPSPSVFSDVSSSRAECVCRARGIDDRTGGAAGQRHPRRPPFWPRRVAMI